MSIGIVYQTEDGYGSIGWLIEMKSDTVSVDDPVLGEVEVLYEELVHIFDPETGSVSGFTEIRPAHEFAAAANPDISVSDVSGYPLAWERVRQWREGAALGWRTVALVGVFCLTTVQRPIGVAEKAYRAFAPALVDMIEDGKMPTDRQLEVTLRAAEVGGLERTLTRNIIAMLEYAPWLSERLHASRDYTRGFRNRVALDRVPVGLSLAKLSFLVSILGRDAACFDARLYTAFFRGDREEISRVQNSLGKSSSGGITSIKVQRYMRLEDKLRRTQFWDPSWPMPFAQAQWRMWESLGDAPALHSALWEVVPGPAQGSGEIRRVKNRLLR